MRINFSDSKKKKKRLVCCKSRCGFSYFGNDCDPANLLGLILLGYSPLTWDHRFHALVMTQQTFCLAAFSVFNRAILVCVLDTTQIGHSGVVL